MKRFQHPVKPTRHDIKRSYLDMPDKLTTRQKAAWNRLITRLRYAE